jgi:hypothetical protein
MIGSDLTGISSKRVSLYPRGRKIVGFLGFSGTNWCSMGPGTYTMLKPGGDDPLPGP